MSEGKRVKVVSRSCMPTSNGKPEFVWYLTFDCGHQLEVLTEDGETRKEGTCMKCPKPVVDKGWDYEVRS